jgi:hypothetical protein
MGIYMLFLLFAYCIGVTILALVVLAIAPAFHITIGNLIVFFIGAIGGTLALFGMWNVLIRTFALYRYIPFRNQGHVTIILAFLGALVGGAALVSLKIRFRGSHREK